MVEGQKDEDIERKARAEAELKYLGELAAAGWLLTEDELEWLGRPAGTASTMVEGQKDEDIERKARAEAELKYLGGLVAAGWLLTEDELERLGRPAGTASTMVEGQKDEDIEREARGKLKYLGRLAASRLLTEDELEWLGRPARTALAELTEDELSQLANRYIDESQGITLFWRLWEQRSYEDVEWLTFWEFRLGTLRFMLGAERFVTLVAETKAKWKQRFDDADDQERNRIERRGGR